MNRTPGACPDAAELAAFFEGRLEDTQRASFAAHASSCPECRAALGALGRLTTSEPPLVPSALLDAAAVVRGWLEENGMTFVPVDGEAFQGTLGPAMAGVGSRLDAGQIRLRLIETRTFASGAIVVSYAPGS